MAGLPAWSVLLRGAGVLQAPAVDWVLGVYPAQLGGPGCCGLRSLRADRGNFCPAAPVQRLERPPLLHPRGAGDILDHVHGPRRQGELCTRGGWKWEPGDRYGVRGKDFESCMYARNSLSTNKPNILEVLIWG